LADGTPPRKPAKAKNKNEYLDVRIICARTVVPKPIKHSRGELARVNYYEYLLLVWSYFCDIQRSEVHDSEGAIDENQYVAFREVKIVKMPTDLPGTRTMPANVELARTIRAISINLDEAIASYETFVPIGQDASLIDRMNTTDFYPAFDVISDALHRSVIATFYAAADDLATASADALAVIHALFVRLGGQ
jgi:hypothetical protein